ncbi:SLAP domain-containing protein [Lactobacillus xylocopicola]|uniref:S-layer protein n=1 Tax=Lactobacillus xylocopicola TaxID=2976676 RepID=A0ABN6SP37_9LACO|nr:SLAP domain-containing protein [Lactobacillus xylocopicola]BDR61101.1 S-layer protein [Lactobacillus xylocopicola]
MKKNSRIISAAAAAILAVAPVVATSVSTVLADSNIDVKGGGNNAVQVDGAATISLSLDNVTSLVPNAPVGKLKATLTMPTKPTGATATVTEKKVYKAASDTPEIITDDNGNTISVVAPDVEPDPNGKGLVVSGSEVANFAQDTNYIVAEKVDITGLTPGKTYAISANDDTYYLEADSTGKITGIGVVSDMFKLFDTTLTGEPVVKENKAGGAVVTSGSVDLTAADTNIADVAAKITAKYAVSTNGTPTEKADFKDLQADIRAALSGVDTNGNFTQPASPFKITLNLLADSGETGTFEVTVNPAVTINPNPTPAPVNGGGSTTTTPAAGVDKIVQSDGAVPVYQIDGSTVTDTKTTVQNGEKVTAFGDPVIINGKSYTRIKSADSNLYVETKYVDGSFKPAADKVSKTVMHNAYIYDLQHKRVGTETLRAFTKVDVYSKTVKLADGRLAYKIAEGQYVMADNIDGTSRVLKHNAYVYKTGKKRADKRVLRKGKTVITYGSPYKFKNGKLYYRIGGPAKQYVKVANIR